jgi:hypothetical protein
MCVPIFRKSSNALMRSRRNISSPLKAYGYGKHYPVKHRTMKGTIWVLLFSKFHIYFLHLNSFMFFSLCLFLTIQTISFCPFEPILHFLALPFLFPLDSFVLTFTNTGTTRHIFSVSTNTSFVLSYYLNLMIVPLSISFSELSAGQITTRNIHEQMYYIY